MISVHVSGTKQVAGGLISAGGIVEAKVSQRVRYWGLQLETKIKGRASGRPGPRTVTGHYRRSWHTQMGYGNGPTATVSTDAPQAARLEHGFVGTDSLGRHYNQAPFPHVGPSVQEIEPLFADDIANVAGKAFG